MHIATKQTYLDTERDIDFFNVVDGPAMMRLSGSKLMCETAVLTQEMVNANEALLLAVDHLKDIVWQINTKMKDRRDAILLSKEYSNQGWTILSSKYRSRPNIECFPPYRLVLL